MIFKDPSNSKFYKQSLFQDYVSDLHWIPYQTKPEVKFAYWGLLEGIFFKTVWGEEERTMRKKQSKIKEMPCSSVYHLLRTPLGDDQGTIFQIG
jgi:hypothetical protein